jgi:hypothetical protein
VCWAATAATFALLIVDIVDDAAIWNYGVIALIIIAIAVRPGGLRGPRAAAADDEPAPSAEAAADEPAAPHVAERLNRRETWPSRDVRSEASAAASRRVATASSPSRACRFGRVPAVGATAWGLALPAVVVA